MYSIVLKNETATMFFLKKPSLVIPDQCQKHAMSASMYFINPIKLDVGLFRCVPCYIHPMMKSTCYE